MNNETSYSNRELDSKFDDIHEKLDLILKQTTKTNGRVTKLEKISLVSGAVILVLLIVNGSKFIEFVSAIAK